MLKHRSLTVHKFVSVVSPDLLQRYFQSLRVPRKPAGWEYLNGDALEAWLGQPENADAESLIRQDLERVNDIAGDGIGIILKACTKFDVPYEAGKTSEENAMRLFLDHRRAFDFAWSRFLLFASTSKLSVHPIERREFHIEAAGLEDFEAGVRAWFAQQAKGEQGEITHNEDEDEDIILIRHGTYYRAFSHWTEEGLAAMPLRLAVEDVLVYERDSGLLRIKATQQKDRMEYLRLFAVCFIGDETVAQDAAEAEVFSLVPVQDGKFDFNGDGSITRVELKSVRLRLYGMTNPVIEVRSRDVLSAFRFDLGGLTLDGGVLLSAKMRFTLMHPGRRKPVTRTFEITPPSYTNLPDKEDAEAILQYLANQGVKLR